MNEYDYASSFSIRKALLWIASSCLRLHVWISGSVTRDTAIQANWIPKFNPTVKRSVCFDLEVSAKMKADLDRE